jgi:hypothetical protein
VVYAPAPVYYQPTYVQPALSLDLGFGFGFGGGRFDGRGGGFHGGGFHR